MIIQQKLTKEGDAIARFLNENGLGLNDYKILDWSPVFAIIFYEEKEEGFGVKAGPEMAKNTGPSSQRPAQGMSPAEVRDRVVAADQRKS